jgi:hypothetical protein
LLKKVKCNLQPNMDETCHIFFQGKFRKETHGALLCISLIVLSVNLLALIMVLDFIGPLNEAWDKGS